MCQQCGDMSLKEIADVFGLHAVSSVSPAIACIKRSIDEWSLKPDKILRSLGYIKYTWPLLFNSRAT